MINLDAVLQQRGIQAAALAAGWRPRKYQDWPGWVYPVFDYATGQIIGQRWKAAPGFTGKIKYAWLPSKPNNPAVDWYILPGTQAAVAAAGGVCYLANGEPALLAYVAAGVRNVIATTHTEAKVPDNFKAVLTSLGVYRLLDPADNDQAGRDSTVKWRDALLGSGIDFEALQWPGGMPPKGDANDLWQLVEFDAAVFEALLDELEPISLPAPVQVQPTYFGDSAFDETPAGLIDAIAASLGITGFKSNGWSRKNISSPFRADKNPSAGFNRNSGVLHDFGTGESFSPRQVAEQMGIDWQRFYPDRPRPAHTDLAHIAADDLFTADTTSRLNRHAPLWWSGDMPDSWRSAILNYMPPTAAPLVEAAHRAAAHQLIDPCCFTIQQLADVAPALGFELAKPTVARVFKQIADVFFSKSDTIEESSRVSDFDINSPGRRATCYRLRPLADVYGDMLAWARPRIIEKHLPVEGDGALLTKFEAAMLEALGITGDQAVEAADRLNQALAAAHAAQKREFRKAMNRAKKTFHALKWELTRMDSTPLPSASIQNGRDYRAIFLRARVAAAPDEGRSARDVADLVGVRRQNTKSVKKRAGLKDEEQFKIVPIQSASEVRKAAYAVGGFPNALHITDGSKTRAVRYSDDSAVQVVSEALRAGHQVKLRCQVANKQVIVRETPLPMRIADEPEAEKPRTEQLALFEDEQPTDPQPEPAVTEPPPVKVERQPIEKVVRMKPGNYWGPGFDPNWSRAQLVLALGRIDSRYTLKGLTLIDTDTGEVVRRSASAADLVAAICGETLQAEVDEREHLLAEAR